MTDLTTALWLDAEDALAQLPRRAGSDPLRTAVAANLIAHGVAIVPAAVPPALCDAAVRDFDAYVAGLGAGVEAHRDASGRLLRYVNFHLASDAALCVAATSGLLDLLDFVFGEEAAIYSSLYFEYGTQQMIHRDSPFFETFPRNRFVGLWVALEDVSVDAGPLMYVPGGHRFECDPHAIHDEVIARPGVDSLPRSQQIEQSLQAYYGRVVRECERFGPPLLLPIRKGDAVIWHPQAPHGGSPARNPSLTRRSIVFHCVPKGTQVYQQEVFFSHRASETPPPRYGYAERGRRQVALSGEPGFQH